MSKTKKKKVPFNKTKLGSSIIRGFRKGIRSIDKALGRYDDWDTKTNEKFSQEVLNTRQSYNGKYSPPCSPYNDDKQLQKERMFYVRDNNSKQKIDIPVNGLKTNTKTKPLNSRLRQLNESTNETIKNFSSNVKSTAKDVSQNTRKRVVNRVTDTYWSVKTNIKNRVNRTYIDYTNEEFIDVDLYDRNFQIVYDEPYHGTITTPYMIDVYRGISGVSRVRPRPNILKNMNISRMRAKKIEGDGVYIICRKTINVQKEEVIVPIIHYTDADVLNENQVIYLKVVNKYNPTGNFIKYNCNKIYIDASEDNPAEIYFVVAVE